MNVSAFQYAEILRKHTRIVTEIYLLTAAAILSITLVGDMEQIKCKVAKVALEIWVYKRLLGIL